MNISKLLNFIGEKIPKYRLTSDNEYLKRNFYDTHENDVREGNIDGDEIFSFYMAVPGEGTMDDNGKNGKFIRYGASAEIYRDSEGERDIDWNDYEYQANYKNDVKDGNEEVYKTSGGSKKLLARIQYQNGIKVKKEVFKYHFGMRDENGNRIPYLGPFLDNVVHYDKDGSESVVDHYRSTTENNGTKIVGSQLSYRRYYKKQEPLIDKRTGKEVPVMTHFGGNISARGNFSDGGTTYFDRQGNEVSKEEWSDIQNKR